MIVVDTNVISYLLIVGDKTEQAQHVYQKDNDWIMPQLWQHEFLNVLSTFVRYGGGEFEDGRLLWLRAIDLFEKRGRPVDMGFALKISVDHQISAYDAQFLALARSYQRPLVSEDRKILNLFPDVAQSMAEFLAVRGE
ncbi:MAG: type II toxin-antitoxin system VapC family toxin [Ardenticatenaceae bacterium]|nr:type II toxin-antitoxin system VapC family toxin [Ardenticatenaceae bacterium]